MLTLAERTRADLIVPHLQACDAAGVIQELCQVLQRAGLLPDLLRFYHTALNRELTISSEVESGAAFPHGPVPGIPKVVFALGRSDAPVAWSASPLRTVRLVFLIAVPDRDMGGYQNLVGGLTHVTRTTGLRDRLLAATEPGGIMDVLREVPIREPAGCAAVAAGDRPRSDRGGAS